MVCDPFPSFFFLLKFLKSSLPSAERKEDDKEKKKLASKLETVQKQLMVEQTEVWKLHSEKLALSKRVEESFDLVRQLEDTLASVRTLLHEKELAVETERQGQHLLRLEALRATGLAQQRELTVQYLQAELVELQQNAKKQAHRFREAEEETTKQAYEREGLLRAYLTRLGTLEREIEHLQAKFLEMIQQLQQQLEERPVRPSSPETASSASPSSPRSPQSPTFSSFQPRKFSFVHWLQQQALATVGKVHAVINRGHFIKAIESSGSSQQLNHFTKALRDVKLAFVEVTPGKTSKLFVPTTSLAGLLRSVRDQCGLDEGTPIEIHLLSEETGQLSPLSGDLKVLKGKKEPSLKIVYL